MAVLDPNLDFLGKCANFVSADYDLEVENVRKDLAVVAQEDVSGGAGSPFLTLGDGRATLEGVAEDVAGGAGADGGGLRVIDVDGRGGGAGDEVADGH